MKEILTIENLFCGYGKREVLHGIDFRITQGEKVLIIGPNGSGKSTFLKAIMSIVKPSKGIINYKKKNITKIPTHEIVNLGIGYLPQTKNIFPSLSVKENLRLSCFSYSYDNFLKKLNFVFEIFPFLKERFNDKTGLFSGGQRQMLALGMALMRDVDLLMLDELTAGLSPKLSQEIIEGLYKVQIKNSLTMIIIDHNIKYFDGLYNRIVIIKEGRIVADKEHLSKKEIEKYFFT